MCAPPWRPSARAEEIRDVNTRYHDVAAVELRRQVGDRLRRRRPGAGARQAAQGARLRARPRLRALARDRRRHRLLQPQPAAGGRRARGDLHRHLARDGARRWRPTPSGSASTSRPRAPTPSRCRSRTRASTSCSATRCCTTCPTCDRRSTSSTACCAPAGGSRSPASPRGSATGWRRSPSAARRALAPLWRRALRAGPRRRAGGAPATASGDDHGLERFVDIHAFAPGDLEPPRPARPASSDVTVRGEELVANWFGWFNRALEATADPDDVPMLWRHYAFRGYLLLQQLDQPRARAAAAAGDLLQPAADRA